MAQFIRVEISPGELIDKMTILEIKRDRITNAAQLRNVQHELAMLTQTHDQTIPKNAALATLTNELKTVNEQLWEIEDEIRICERDQNFGTRFIELARSVYRTNDERARLKREINTLLNSTLIEEKSYANYSADVA
ncbi:MAG: DUF6165 family protein [Planctomycetaceae bacterium]